jgi:hypothetical protein
MAVTAAPAPPPPAPVADVVRHAEVVGVWAVDCLLAQRPFTDWAAELLGDGEHRIAEATLEHDGYQVDHMAVRRVAHQRGTAYVRLFCAVTVRAAGLPAELRARTLRGIVDELLLARARTRRVGARLIDAAVVAVP